MTYKGVFNRHGEVITLYTDAINDRVAFKNLSKQLVDKVDEPVGLIRWKLNTGRIDYSISQVE